MLIKRRILILFVLLLPIFSSNAQDPVYISRDSVVIIPGKQYANGPYHRFWFGDTWRDLWVTPIVVPVLDIDEFAGGLELLKRGGGRQTRSLHFTGADGKRYKFRSVQKFTDRYLPEELKETLADDVIRDMFSTINPMAAIIAAPMINAAGILQAKPILCVMPDDEKLGEYRNDYAGLLGTIEEHPDEVDDEEVFGDADKVFGSDDLFEELKKTNKYRVDPKEFLKARLLDIFLGDWDRHYDQWRWAVYEIDDIKYCKPIPRDRDQAFSRYDGVIYSLVEYFVPQAEHFSEEYPLMLDLTWSGQFLDRHLLSGLSKEVWDSVTDSIAIASTDSVILYSVKKMPAVMFEKEGERLFNTLIERRNKLKEASNEFFMLIAEESDVWASDKDEYLQIDMIDEKQVRVSIYDKKSDESVREYPYFERIYHSDTTNEIRIYMLDGEDDVTVRGDQKNDIRIFIAAGDGADTFKDERPDNGATIFNSSNIIFWDSGKKTKADPGYRSVHYDIEWDEKGMDPVEYDPSKRDWGYDLFAREWFSINTDDGLFIGGGPEYTKYGFRSKRFKYQMHALLGYSFFLNGIRTKIRGDFHLFPYSQYLRAEAYFSQIDVSNFFGLGNEAEKLTNRGNYHKVAMSQLRFLLDWKWQISEFTFLNLGIKSENAYIRREPNRLIDSLKPFGYRKDAINLAAYIFGYELDDREIEGYYTANGSFVNLTFDHYPNISFLDNNRFPYLKAKIDARFFATYDLLSKTTFALKLHGERSWGDIPFYELPNIGGSGSLRGYNRERYLGNSALSAMLDIRFKLFDFKYIIPFEAGGILFSDAGRVWLDGERSEELHYSFGPGLWFSTYKNTLLISTYLAKIDNGFSFYLSTGFLF